MENGCSVAKQTMIERVANALRPFMAEGPDAGNAARAAIEALREPSDALVLVYARNHYHDNWGAETAADARKFTDAESAWTDMLDAVLTGT